MKFITTDSQIKEYNSSVTVDLSFESLRSCLQDAETKIITIIGEENADAIASTTDFVANLMRAAVVNFALFDYSDSGQLLIGDEGMYVLKSETKLPASDKKIISFKRGCVEKAWKAFETALSIMESKYIDWPIWYLSDERKKYLNSIVNFSSEIEYYSTLKITPHLFQKIRSEIRNVEEDSIQQILGDDVFNQFRLRCLSHSLDELDRELLKRITRAVAPLSIAYSIPYLSVEVSNEGVYQASQSALASQSDNIEVRASASTRTLQNTMLRLISKGEAELETLRKWMNKNQSSFPGYGGNTIAPMASINQDPDLKDSGVYFM